MLHEEPTKKREQFVYACIDELVPQNHLLRKIDKVIDWSFIYDLVKEKYSPDRGRPSLDPVILIKIVLIFGTAKENHGFRYTNMIGNERMKMKAALTFACMNLKKLARIMGSKPSSSGHFCACFLAICDMLISRMKTSKFCFTA